MASEIAEGKTLEFKRDLSSPKPLLKTLVEIANTAGRRLLIGVADNRTVVGVDNPLDEDDDRREGISKIRSQVITRVFRELNLIEQWGSGVRRIYSEAAALGLPEPEFAEVGMRVRVVVRLATPLSLTVSPAAETDQVTGQVQRLLACLTEAPLSTKEAMERLDLSHLPTFQKTYLQPALVAGLIEMTQPYSPNSPTQKYRLTKLGRTAANR